MLQSRPMPKHLVIVESPAKARTIERYLGSDYHVLASYGHVRDLPENPGKGKFGVDVEHDFAPEYVVSRRPAQAGRRRSPARRKKADTVYLATDLDREGEAIAWHVAEAANVPADKTRRVTFSEITERAIREAFAHPAGDRHEPRRRPADAPHRRPAGRLHAEPAPVPQGPRRPLGRTRPVGRGAPRRRARARDRRLRGARVLDDRGAAGDRHRRDVRGRAGPDRRAAGRGRRRRDRRASRRAALRATHPVVTKVGTRKLSRSPGAAVHDQHAPAGSEPQAQLQPEADDVDRPAAVRGRSRRRTARSGSSPTCGPTRRRSPVWRWARPGRSSATGSASPTRCPRAASTGPRPRAPRRPTSRSGRRRSAATRTRSRSALKPEELRLYRLIWQRALASQMAAKEMETTTIELADGPYELRASATRTLFDGFARVYTEGRDDDAEDERGSPPARARGGRPDRRPRGDPDPALHRAAAALHRGDADQGTRGARDRPSVDVRGDDLDDRRPGLRRGRGSGGCTPSSWPRS